MTILSVRDILEQGKYIITYTYDTKCKTCKIHISWTNETFIIKYQNGKLSNTFTNESIVCNSKYAKAYVYVILKNICVKYNFPMKLVKFVCDDEETPAIYFDDDSTDNDFFYLVKDFYEDGLKPIHYEMAKLHNLEKPMREIINHYMGIINES